MKNLFIYSILLLGICSCNSEGISNSKQPLDLVKIRVISKGSFGGRIDSVIIDKGTLSLTKYNFDAGRTDTSITQKTISKEQMGLVNELVQKGKDSTLIFNLCTTSSEYLIQQNDKTTVIQDNSCGLESIFSKLVGN